MPSVRDSLKGEQSARPDAPDGLDIGGLPPSIGSQDNQADLIAARLRETADQRASMAQTEINKLQGHIEVLQQRMEELTKAKMPPGNLSADLEDAMQRLDDANADLARAHEAKQNTELTSSLRAEHHESAHLEHAALHAGGGTGVPKVGAVIGRTGATPTKLGIKGPSHHR